MHDHSNEVLGEISQALDAEIIAKNIESQVDDL